ncbi:hypothetical protein LP414_11230 [Polaromonas sp. P1(28)-13]|nr:hypothetical protein LP417_19530 [Polaromonas sp. P1-6]UUZ77621.1 hypothetical protein LP414_11230 [Polaromonas sp. P1(28)-13]
MKRADVEHVLRAAAAIAQENSLHDLAVSKCVAGRDKDADFVRALFKHQMIELAIMTERIAQLDAAKHPVQHITQWTQRRAQEAGI